MFLPLKLSYFTQLKLNPSMKIYTSPVLWLATNLSADKALSGHFKVT